MARRKAARDALRGEGELILDVVSEAFTPTQWAEFLRALLEGVAAKGDRGLAQKLLVGAGATMGSALHAAIRGGHGKLVNDLLQENGASVSAKDGRGDTPLHVAAEVGDVEMARFLLLENDAENDARNNRGFCPLHVSAQHGRVGVGQVLLDAGTDVSLPLVGFEWTAAHIAAREGHVEFLRMLIENGANVKGVVRACHQTPAHFAARSRDSSARVISMLVAAGANLEMQDSTGATPLHVAARAQSHDAVLGLLKHGAEVNAKNSRGKTPLHLAALEVGGEEGAAELVDSLLRAGADETIPDDSGQSAVDIIGECVEEEDESLAEEVSRARYLLANAPADRAWRRRGYLVLCRAHPERCDSRGELNPVEVGSAGGYPVDDGIGRDWTTVASWMLGVQEDGVFRLVVGFL